MPSKSGTAIVTIGGTKFDDLINRKKFSQNFFDQEVVKIKRQLRGGNFTTAITLIQDNLKNNKLSPHDRELLIILANELIGFLSDSYPGVAKQVIDKSTEGLSYIMRDADDIKKPQFAEKLSDNSIVLSCVIKNCDTSNIEWAKWAIAQAVYLKQSGKDVDMNAVAEAITYITRINRDNEEFLQKLLEECGENIRLILNEVTDGRIKVFVGGLTGSDAWKAWENSRTNQPQPTPTRSQNSAHNGSNNSQPQNLHASAQQHKQNTMRFNNSNSRTMRLKKSHSNIQSTQSVAFPYPVGTCSNTREVEGGIQRITDESQISAVISKAKHVIDNYKSYGISRVSLCIYTLAQLQSKYPDRDINKESGGIITKATKKDEDMIAKLSDYDIVNIVYIASKTKDKDMLGYFSGMFRNTNFINRMSSIKDDKLNDHMAKYFREINEKINIQHAINAAKNKRLYKVANIMNGERQVNTVSSSTSRSSGFNTRRSRPFDVNDICNSIESCSSVSELNEVLNRVQVFRTNRDNSTLVLNIIIEKMKRLNLDGLSKESLIKILRIFARSNKESLNESFFIDFLENSNVQKIFNEIFNTFNLENIRTVVATLGDMRQKGSERFSNFVNKLDAKVVKVTFKHVSDCLGAGKKLDEGIFSFLRNDFIYPKESRDKISCQIIDECLSNESLGDEILLDCIKGIEFVFRCSDSSNVKTFDKVIEFLRNDRIRNIIRKYGIDMNFFIHGIDEWCERLSIQSKKYIDEIEKFMKTPTVVQPKPKSQPVQPKPQPTPQQQQSYSSNPSQSQTFGFNQQPTPAAQTFVANSTPQQPAPTQQMQQQNSYNQQQNQNSFPPAQQSQQSQTFGFNQQPAPATQTFVASPTPSQSQPNYNQPQYNPQPQYQQSQQYQQQQYQQQSYGVPASQQQNSYNQQQNQNSFPPAQQSQQSQTFGFNQQPAPATQTFVASPTPSQSQPDYSQLQYNSQPQYQQSQQYQQQRYQTPQMMSNNGVTQPQLQGQVQQNGFDSRMLNYSTQRLQQVQGQYGYAPTPQQPAPTQQMQPQNSYNQQQNQNSFPPAQQSQQLQQLQGQYGYAPAQPQLQQQSYSSNPSQPQTFSFNQQPAPTQQMQQQSSYNQQQNQTHQVGNNNVTPQQPQPAQPQPQTPQMGNNVPTPQTPTQSKTPQNVLSQSQRSGSHVERLKEQGQSNQNRGYREIY